jgi:hypothetical protein
MKQSMEQQHTLSTKRLYCLPVYPIKTVKSRHTNVEKEKKNEFGCSGCI